MPEQAGRELKQVPRYFTLLSAAPENGVRYPNQVVRPVHDSIGSKRSLPLKRAGINTRTAQCHQSRFGL